ncbi:unnamed protein product [Caenorhabditis angaria]|uniref:Uncharacterized protein n=1 Tax=Caenorhabditis angaria TaxID=860376 RepID=A0A9P1IDL8_9PELO|nr:unnamed protein product [Caenorhabditis angaria]
MRLINLFPLKFTNLQTGGESRTSYQSTLNMRNNDQRSKNYQYFFKTKNCSKSTKEAENDSDSDENSEDAEIGLKIDELRVPKIEEESPEAAPIMRFIFIQQRFMKNF